MFCHLLLPLHCNPFCCRTLVVDKRGGDGHWVVYIVDSFGNQVHLEGSSTPGGELEGIYTDDHIVTIQVVENLDDLITNSSSGSSSSGSRGSAEGYPHPPLAQQLHHLMQHGLEPKGDMAAICSNLPVLLDSAARYLSSARAGQDPLAALPAWLRKQFQDLIINAWPKLTLFYMVPWGVVESAEHHPQLTIVPTPGQTPLTATWEPPTVVDVARYLVGYTPPVEAKEEDKAAAEEPDSDVRDTIDLKTAAAAAAAAEFGAVAVVSARRTPVPTPRSRCASPCPPAAANPPDSPRSAGRCDQASPRGAAAAAAAQQQSAAVKAKAVLAGSNRNRSRSSSPCRRAASPAAVLQQVPSSPRQVDSSSSASAVGDECVAMVSPRGAAPTAAAAARPQLTAAVASEQVNMKSPRVPTTPAAPTAAAERPLSRLSLRGPAVLGEVCSSSEEGGQQVATPPHLQAASTRCASPVAQPLDRCSVSSTNTQYWDYSSRPASPAAAVAVVPLWPVAKSAAALPEPVSTPVAGGAASGAVAEDGLPHVIIDMLGSASSSSSSKGALLLEALRGLWGGLSSKVQSALSKAAGKAAKGGAALLAGLKALVKKIVKGLFSIPAQKTQE
jgi:hypothetical protein